MNPLTVTAEYHAQDLSDTRETDPLYAREGIVHPGTILRCCNWVLSHNVVLPAWMHVGSSVRNLGVAPVPQKPGATPWRTSAGTTAFAPFKEDTSYFGDRRLQWMINFRVRDLAKMAAQLREKGGVGDGAGHKNREDHGLHDVAGHV